MSRYNEIKNRNYDFLNIKYKELTFIVRAFASKSLTIRNGKDDI